MSTKVLASLMSLNNEAWQYFNMNINNHLISLTCLIASPYVITNLGAHLTVPPLTLPIVHIT